MFTNSEEYESSRDQGRFELRKVASAECVLTDRASLMRFGPPNISLRKRELFDFSVKCPRRYAERFRGLRLVAVGLTQRLLDEIFFALLDVADGFRANFLAVPSGVVLQVHRKIAQRDVIAVRNHHRTFNDASKLTNVSRPRII